MNARTLARTAAAAAAGVVLLAGCGSSSSSGAAAKAQVFQTQANLNIQAAAQTCLVHQKHEPTTAYKGGADGTTTDVLTFLAYYSANGNKKFCDGKAANAKDKTWAALYTSLDGPTSAQYVKGITG